MKGAGVAGGTILGAGLTLDNLRQRGKVNDLEGELDRPTIESLGFGDLNNDRETVQWSAKANAPERENARFNARFEGDRIDRENIFAGETYENEHSEDPIDISGLEPGAYDLEASIEGIDTGRTDTRSSTLVYHADALEPSNGDSNNNGEGSTTDPFDTFMNELSRQSNLTQDAFEDYICGNNEDSDRASEIYIEEANGDIRIRVGDAHEIYVQGSQPGLAGSRDLRRTISELDERGKLGDVMAKYHEETC